MGNPRGFLSQLVGWGVLALLGLWILAPNFVSDIVLVVFLLGAAAVIGKSLMRGSQQSSSQQQKAWTEALPKPKPAQTPEQIAKRAMAQVGRHPGTGGIRLKDIGILTYDGGQQPKVSRTETIPAQATHLRPYMVLDLAILKSAHGRIQFDLLDEAGKVRFTSNERYKLESGENFITTSNWQPMGDNEQGGTWTLRISVGDQALAVHTFKITPDASSEFRAYLRSDGEVDEWLSKAAKISSTEEISLDDLLADQEEISAEMFGNAK